MGIKSVNVTYLYPRTGERIVGKLAGYGLLAGMAVLLVLRVIVALSEARHHAVGI